MNKETTNIYQKIHAVQTAVKKGLQKLEENKFQKYKYVGEYDLLKELKPHLESEKLALLFSDFITPETPFIKEKTEKEWVVNYCKKLEIINTVEPSQLLIVYFWSCGSNVDLAKAKGSADTYAVKYFLQKFFLVPTTDEGLDPDSKGNIK